MVESHKKMYERYFEVKSTPKRGKRIITRDDMIKKYKEKVSGYFVIITNDIKNSVDALKIYPEIFMSRQRKPANEVPIRFSS
jgi:hypothetical protein